MKILKSCLGVNLAIWKKLAKIFNVQCDFTGKLKDQIFENVLLVSFASFVHVLINSPSGARLDVKLQSEMNISKFAIRNMTRILPL